MTLHVLQHAAHEGPGAIADWAAARGHDLRIVRLDRGEDLPALPDVDLLVVLGGPMSVHDGLPYQAAERRLIEDGLLAARPTLGICLGMQLLAQVLGAEVAPQAQPEIGWWGLTPGVLPQGHFLRDASLPASVFHWHGEGVALPQNATLLASSAATPVQGFAYREHAVGLQFHPEATAAWIEGIAAVDGDALSQNRPYGADRDALAGTPAQYAAGHAYLFSVLDALAARPRHDYRRIDCGYYDHIEVSILRRTRRPIESRGRSRVETVADALLLDTRTARGEEYVLVEDRGWVRADRIALVGVTPDGACAL